MNSQPEVSKARKALTYLRSQWREGHYQFGWQCIKQDDIKNTKIIR